MSLQLILGNAGSGKTGYINRTLIKEAMESLGKQFIAWFRSSSPWRPRRPWWSSTPAAAF